MLDIHSHILFGIDDGAKSLNDSIELIKQAQTEGVTKIIATPHKDPKYQPTKETILAKVKELNNKIKELNLNIKVLPGQEVRLYQNLIDDLLSNQLMTLNNENKYILIEFPSTHVPQYSSQILYELQLKGIRPIIVHPERNDDIIKNPKILEDFVKNGALAQITAGSIIGKFGRKSKKTSYLLLKHNLISFIASDAHNLKTRTFNLKHAKSKLYKKFGKDFTEELFNNASLILTNDYIHCDYDSLK